MNSFKTKRYALFLIILSQLCHSSLPATLPALNLTNIPTGLLTPNFTLGNHADFKPQAPDPYLATANTETIIFYEYGETPLEEATLILVLYQMYMDYQPHINELNTLVGVWDRFYTRDQVTLVVHPNPKMTWAMFGNTWLLLGHYQENFQCVAMDFDITHDERVYVGYGEVKLIRDAARAADE